MKLLCALVLCALLAACAPPPAEDEAVAPPDTITPYASTAPPVPPSQVAKDNRAVAVAAVPTEVPGFTPAGPAPSLKLCPPLAAPVPASVVHASGSWTGAEGRSLTVTAVLDPANAPADQLLATLLPPDCPSDADGKHYVYDRQPIERSDGWTGVLNTILATDLATGRTSYESAYLLSKGDALVNVVAGRADRATFDPSVDETAADYLELVLERFAV